MAEDRRALVARIGRHVVVIGIALLIVVTALGDHTTRGRVFLVIGLVLLVVAVYQAIRGFRPRD